MLYSHRASETESCLPEETNFSTDTSSAFSLSTNQRIRIYGGIVAFAVCVVLMRALLCYLVILAASRSLHNKMLTAVLRAPVLFFDTHPVGEYLFHWLMYKYIAIIALMCHFVWTGLGMHTAEIYSQRRERIKCILAH